MATPQLRDNHPSTRSDGQLIAGRYRTQLRIGKGRLGHIFLATDESYENLGVEQCVAIQIIAETIVGNNKLFNKLNVGYSLLGSGAHPNIVDCLHFGRDAKIGFVAMELLEGASLRLLLDDAEMLPLEEAKPVIRSVGEALRHMHAKDMVHGNVTSKNIFITEDLEVRLLDVVPLDTANAIFRGTPSSEPFGRCTVGDDVFGLACLAYEALTGKHPFNYSSPAEARLAGLSAARIETLTDREWNALQGALSFDRERRTVSVADFMRDFGINGIERLRATPDQQQTVESVPHAAMELLPPLASSERTVVTTPVVDHEAVALHENWPPDARPYREKKRPIRAIFLGLIFAGLSAWTILGQPEERFIDWYGYVDTALQVGLADLNNEIVDIAMTDADQSMVPDAASQVVKQTVESPAIGVPTDTTDVGTTASEISDTNAPEVVAADKEQELDLAAPPALSTTQSATQKTVLPDEIIIDQTESEFAAEGTDDVNATNDSVPVQAERRSENSVPPTSLPQQNAAESRTFEQPGTTVPDEVIIDATKGDFAPGKVNVTDSINNPLPQRTESRAELNIPDAAAPARDGVSNSSSAQADTRLVVTEPVVTVFEGDGVARIVLHRNRYSATPLIWWTIGNTAHVDADFIPVNRQIVADATEEDGTLLHVPLVNDSIAESQESFFVNLGVRDVESGKIEEIAAVRVDIVDDDQ